MNTTLIILSVAGWILLGIIIPVFRYIIKKLYEEIDSLKNWKNSMEEEIMIKTEHNQLCNQIQKENIQLIFNKIEHMMKIHKEWLEERLGRLESDMKLYVQKQKE